MDIKTSDTYEVIKKAVKENFDIGEEFTIEDIANIIDRDDVSDSSIRSNLNFLNNTHVLDKFIHPKFRYAIYKRKDLSQSQ